MTKKFVNWDLEFISTRRKVRCTSDRMRQTCLPAGRETNSSDVTSEYRVSLLRGSLFKVIRN